MPIPFGAGVTVVIPPVNSFSPSHKKYCTFRLRTFDYGTDNLYDIVAYGPDNFEAQGLYFPFAFFTYDRLKNVFGYYEADAATLIQYPIGSSEVYFVHSTDDSYPDGIGLSRSDELFPVSSFGYVMFFAPQYGGG